MAVVVRVSVPAFWSFPAWPCPCVCSFRYGVYTPTLKGIDRDVAAGSAYRVYGAMVGKTPDAFDIRIGATICPADAPTDPSGQFPSARNVYSEFTVTCTSHVETAGYYNVTVKSTEGTGTFPSRRYYTSPVDAASTTAMVTVRPVVTSLSSNAGGLLGGFPIVVFGTGFSTTPR